jgi:hypothetical protein
MGSVIASLLHDVFGKNNTFIVATKTCRCRTGILLRLALTALSAANSAWRCIYAIETRVTWSDW